MGRLHRHDVGVERPKCVKYEPDGVREVGTSTLISSQVPREFVCSHGERDCLSNLRLEFMWYLVRGEYGVLIRPCVISSS